MTNGADNTAQPVPTVLRPLALPPAHRRWILLNAVAFAAVANIVINAAIAVVASAGKNTIPVSGSPIPGPTLISDTCATFFFLPLLACPLVTIGVWADRRRGVLSSLTPIGWISKGIVALPRNPIVRGASVGALTVILFAPLAIAALLAVDVDHFARSGFILYKVVLATLTGAVVTPVAALCAMADSPEIL
jgi:hypothetical protein